MNSRRSLLRDVQGVVIVEFALCLPLLILLLTGAVDVVRYILAEQRAGAATRTVVDLATRATTLRSGDIADLGLAANLVFDPHGAATMAGTLYSITFDAQGNEALAWSQPINGGGGSSTDALAAASGLGTDDSVMVFQSRAAFTPLFAPQILAPATMIHSAVAHPRKGAPVTYSP